MDQMLKVNSRTGSSPERDVTAIKVLHVVGRLHVVVNMALASAAERLNCIELTLLRGIFTGHSSYLLNSNSELIVISHHNYLNIH